MGSEKQTWTDHIRPVLLKEGLDPLRVENVAHPGTPDVNYIEGWIELKYIERWPVRGGIVRLDHFTQQQRVCIRRRAIHGGRVFVLLGVGAPREFLLFGGREAAAHLGSFTKEELYALSLARANLFDPAVFLPHLVGAR